MVSVIYLWVLLSTDWVLNRSVNTKNLEPRSNTWTWPAMCPLTVEKITLGLSGRMVAQALSSSDCSKSERAGKRGCQTCLIVIVCISSVTLLSSCRFRTTTRCILHQLFLRGLNRIIIIKKDSHHILINKITNKVLLDTMVDAWCR